MIPNVTLHMEILIFLRVTFREREREREREKELHIRRKNTLLLTKAIIVFYVVIRGIVAA